MIEETLQFLKETQKNHPMCHDYNHSIRVWKLSKHIAHEEKLFSPIIEIAALLHDVNDWKFQEDNTINISSFLRTLKFSNSDIEHINSIIENVTFKGANSKHTPLSSEGQVVQDADRLDAMGAIGIARAFSYGGYKQREMYDPKEKPIHHKSFDEYKKSSSCTINHFYEKLFLLKDMMNTKSGKTIALNRHNLMKNYVKQFKEEWEFK